MHAHRALFALLLTILLVAVSMAMASPQQHLQRFVDEVKSASGSFEQVTHNAEGRVLSRQTGEFAFARPGQFRWDVREPFEQLIVADGETLVQFDPDLDQATVRPVAAAVGNAPAQVLFGEGNLDDAFRLESRPEHDGLVWVRAHPESTEAGYAYLDIGMHDGLPQRIEILDAFGQRTRIEFTTLVPNAQIDASAFRFTAPEGVDLVRMP